MDNPLELLRRYYMDKLPIEENSGHVVFYGQKFPLAAKTNYIIFQKNRNVKEYYTLGSIIFFLKSFTLNHLEYVHKSQALNIIPVRRPDRHGLKRYLSGKDHTSPSIDESAPVIDFTPSKSFQHSQQQNIAKESSVKRKIEEDNFSDRVKQSITAAETSDYVYNKQSRVKIESSKEIFKDQDDCELFGHYVASELRLIPRSNRDILKKKELFV